MPQFEHIIDISYPNDYTFDSEKDPEPRRRKEEFMRVYDVKEALQEIDFFDDYQEGQPTEGDNWYVATRERFIGNDARSHISYGIWQDGLVKHKHRVPIWHGMYAIYEVAPALDVARITFFDDHRRTGAANQAIVAIADAFLWQLEIQEVYSWGQKPRKPISQRVTRTSHDTSGTDVLIIGEHGDIFVKLASCGDLMALARMMAKPSDGKSTTHAPALARFADSLETGLAAQRDKIYPAIALQGVEEWRALEYLIGQWRIRSSLPARAVLKCVDCRASQVVNPSYEKETETRRATQRLLSLASPVAFLAGGHLGVGAVLSLGRFAASKASGFVCRRCQGRSAWRTPAWLCTSCGELLTSAVIDTCPKCNVDLSGGEASAGARLHYWFGPPIWRDGDKWGFQDGADPIHAYQYWNV